MIGCSLAWVVHSSLRLGGGSHSHAGTASVMFNNVRYDAAAAEINSVTVSPSDGRGTFVAVSDPPGAHVKNIADPDERARAQLRSEGPDAHDDGDRVGGIVKTAQRRARPGTFLLESGYQVDGEDGRPVAAMSSNVGGMAAQSNTSKGPFARLLSR